MVPPGIRAKWHPVTYRGSQGGRGIIDPKAYLHKEATERAQRAIESFTHDGRFAPLGHAVEVGEDRSINVTLRLAHAGPLSQATPAPSTAATAPVHDRARRLGEFLLAQYDGDPNKTFHIQTILNAIEGRTKHFSDYRKTLLDRLDSYVPQDAKNPPLIHSGANLKRKTFRFTATGAEAMRKFLKDNASAA